MPEPWPRQRPDYLDREVEVVPKSSLGSTTFVSIEYPGILSKRQASQPADTGHGEGPDSDDDGDDKVHPSLDRALASLASVPAQYATANMGLEQIARAIQGKQRSIECRLFDAVRPGPSGLRQASTPAQGPQSDNSIFRHAIRGDFLDTHSVVVKLRKRVWRRKPRGASQRSEARTGDDQVYKEYALETLGVTKHTARFRNMADYLYDPGLVKNAETGAMELSNAEAVHLVDAIRQMDIDKLESFSLGADDEQHEIIDALGETMSNIRMPPPSIFDKGEFPYPYAFRQNPTSKLVDENGRRRYVNTNRKRTFGPKAFHLGDTEPPHSADEGFQAYRYDPRLVEAILKKFEEQPMWSRLALQNQFSKEDRRLLINQKHHINSCCYTIAEGCWRDVLVRFGYDPRKDPESRFYQRIAFQSKARQGRGVEVDERGDETIAQHALETNDDLEGKNHTFDGVTPGLTRGNYLLIDIHDEIVRELIDKSGPGYTIDDPSLLDRRSGWFAASHWDRIRSMLEFRMDVLNSTGQPASREACDARLQKFDSAEASSANRRSTSGASSPEAVRRTSHSGRGDERPADEEQERSDASDTELEDDDAEQSSAGEEERQLSASASASDDSSDEQPVPAKRPTARRGRGRGRPIGRR